MQETLLFRSKQISDGLDLLEQARLFATKGSGVSDITGPNGEKGFSFDGTSNASLAFPVSKASLFSFINTPFELEMLLNLNNNSACQPIGNLLNGSGAADWAITLNNTYQEACQLSLDGFNNSTVSRYRFGNSGTVKLPVGSWVTVKLRRLTNQTTMETLVNGALLNQRTSVTTFNIGSSIPFTIGTSADKAFPVSGKIAKMIARKL